MTSNAWQHILPILRQKSTLAGIVGLIGAIFTVFGVELAPEQSANISSALLALVSVVAIIVQPKPVGGHYGPRDYKPGDEYKEPGQPIRTFDGQKWS